MVSFIIRRILVLVPTIIIISILAYIVIELPPGDYVTNYMMVLQQTQGRDLSEAMLENLRKAYGLDRPVYVRYFIWFGKFVRGDLGYSLRWKKPVTELLADRLPLTIVVTMASLAFSWIVAFPIGVYSAMRQYSIGDYIFTFFGFFGLSVPQFLFALVLMFLSAKYLDIGVGGLFSREFASAGWSFGKVIDLLKHLWIPMIVIGMAGTAGLIRILRANLLDELKKPYVELARAKGLKEARLVIKYPLRIAVNPFISSVGWILPALISGTVITAVVLDLPTAGPIFLQSLRTQDMALAGSFIMLMSILTVIGTLLSDILLAAVDPRIRYD